MEVYLWILGVQRDCGGMLRVVGSIPTKVSFLANNLILKFVKVTNVCLVQLILPLSTNIMYLIIPWNFTSKIPICSTTNKEF